MPKKGLGYPSKSKKAEGAKVSSDEIGVPTSKSAIAEGSSAGAGNDLMCNIATALNQVTQKLYHNCDQSAVSQSGTSSHNIAAELPPRVETYGRNPLIEAQSQREQILPAPLRAPLQARPPEGIYDTLKPNEVRIAEKANREVGDLLEKAKEINQTASKALIELQEAFNALDTVTEGEEAPPELINTAVQTLYEAKQAKNEAGEIKSMYVEEQKTKVETELEKYKTNQQQKQKYIDEIESYISKINLKQTELESEQELAIEKIIEIDNEIRKAELTKERFSRQFTAAENSYMEVETAAQAAAAAEEEAAIEKEVRSYIVPEQSPVLPPRAEKEKGTTRGGSRKLTKKRKTKKGKKSRKSTKKGKSRKSKLAKQKYKKGKKSKMRKKYNKKTKRVNNNNTNTKK